MDKIWLIGLPGSGKTTVGACLARRLNWSFADTDRVAERLAGLSVPEIFSRQGETFFRSLENQAVGMLASQPGPMVIATGGGAPCFYQNLDIMLASGLVVYLQAAPKVLVQRLSAANVDRPLLTGDREKVLTDLLHTRARYYERANLILPAAAAPEEVCDAIMASIF